MGTSNLSFHVLSSSLPDMERSDPVGNPASGIAVGNRCRESLSGIAVGNHCRESVSGIAVRNRCPECDESALVSRRAALSGTDSAQPPGSIMKAWLCNTGQAKP